ncbi:MAG: imidazolonepropionase-like amidohydrolase [Planctomycetota bacterium]|jgi:imidazolonepropionase-like amidohydrolase
MFVSMRAMAAWSGNAHYLAWMVMKKLTRSCTSRLFAVVACIGLVSGAGAVSVAGATQPHGGASKSVSTPAAGEMGGPGLAIFSTKVLAVPLEGRQVIDGGVVLIRDGKIQAVGEQGEIDVPDDYERLDVGRRWLMPGMVELHNHIGPNSIFTNDINDMVYLTNPGLRASPSLNPGNMLQRRGVAGGVTTALFIPGSGTNMGGQGLLMKMGFDQYEPMEVRNPGSLKLAQSGNPERWDAIRPRRSFMNWNTRNTFRRGMVYAKRWDAHEKGWGPKPEKNIQFEIFRALHSGKAKVSTHTQIFQVVSMTVTMVAVEFGLGVFIDHGSFDGFKVAELAEANGVQAILGPRAICPNYPGFIDTDGKILGMAAEYQKRGHTMIGFNTDCVDNGSLQITPPQEELSLQAGMAMRYGFENKNVENVRGLTIVPAVTCGLGDRVGSLEAGKDADILIISGDPGDPRSGIDIAFVDGIRVYDAKRDGRRW